MIPDETVPVTVLSGVLGAGKTTVLNHILGSDHGEEIAVLVNDVGDVNVDAEIVEKQADAEEVVELSNGCICCGLHGQLEQSVLKLVMEYEFDYLVIEPSGISEPAPIAEQFVSGRPSSVYELQSVTTVVDARQFYDAFEDGQPTRHGAEGDGIRPLSDLIVDGIEFCDTLLLNKTDLVTDEEFEAVRTDILTIQPDATIIATEYGAVDPTAFLEGQGFDQDAVEQSARWRKILAGDGHNDHGHSHDDEIHDHSHPHEEYGIDSFVYHRPEPMHPERLADFLQETPKSLLRAKGWVHVAGRPNHAMELSLAGQEAQVTVAGRWVATLSETRQQRYREQDHTNWTEEYGDRETQIVLIGQQMDTDRITQRLDDCVLGSEELSEMDENPFPNHEGDKLRLPARH